MEYELHVKNLSPADEKKLRDVFSGFGFVTKCYIPTDRTTGVKLNFGFVTYNTSSEAEKAMAGVNNNTYLNDEGRRNRVTWSNKTIQMLVMDANAKEELERSKTVTLQNVVISNVRKLGAICTRYGNVEKVTYEVDRNVVLVICKDVSSANKIKTELGEDVSVWPHHVFQDEDAEVSDVDYNENIEPERDLPCPGKTCRQNIVNFWTLFDDVRNDLCEYFKTAWMEKNGKEWTDSLQDRREFLKQRRFTVQSSSEDDEEDKVIACLSFRIWPIEIFVKGIRLLSGEQFKNLKAFEEPGEIESSCVGKNMKKNAILKYETQLQYWKKMNTLFPDKFRTSIENAKPRLF